MGEAHTDTHWEPRWPWESGLALGREAGSQEMKQQDLAPPSPAALWQLLKFTPPWTQPQCPLIPKYSITPFLIRASAGMVPAWPSSAGSGGEGVSLQWPLQSGPSLTLIPGPPMGPGSPFAPVRPCERRDGRRLLPALRQRFLLVLRVIAGDFVLVTA